MSASSLGLDAQALGQCLTVAQQVAIRTALLKIKLQEKLSDIRFWGKVNGQTRQTLPPLPCGDGRARLCSCMQRCRMLPPMHGAQEGRACLPRILSNTHAFHAADACVSLRLCFPFLALRFAVPCTGAQSDYFIAVSTNITNTINKNFYWRSAQQQRRQAPAAPQEQQQTLHQRTRAGF
jgi:hypothetical protein